MRTTATLEPEVEQLLHRSMKERGLSFKKALNDAVKAGLTQGNKKAAKPFVQKTHSMGAEQTFRWDKALAAAAALEDEELVHKLALRK